MTELDVFERGSARIAGPPPTALQIHDHHDNVTGGGFAFSEYHRGTALPQQPWNTWGAS